VVEVLGVVCPSRLKHPPVLGTPPLLDDPLCEDGLTHNEGAVMDALVSAAEAYRELPVEHPAEPQEFVAAIHRAQDLLAVRIARREYPSGWTRYDENGSGARTFVKFEPHTPYTGSRARWSTFLLARGL
jgi:hypothetical protein